MKNIAKINHFGQLVYELQTTHSWTDRRAADNTGLAKVAVQCSAETFVVKSATFAKPKTVSGNAIRHRIST